MRTVSNTLERNLPCAWPPLPLSSVPARSPEEFEEATSCGQIQKVWGVCVGGGGPALSRGGDFNFKTNTSWLTSQFPSVELYVLCSKTSPAREQQYLSKAELALFFYRGAEMVKARILSPC